MAHLDMHYLHELALGDQVRQQYPEQCQQRNRREQHVVANAARKQYAVVPEEMTQHPPAEVLCPSDRPGCAGKHSA
ncbi:hypothetical protein GCM10027428_19070 [Haliea atlantica]